MVLDTAQLRQLGNGEAEANHNGRHQRLCHDHKEINGSGGSDEIRCTNCLDSDQREGNVSKIGGVEEDPCTNVQLNVAARKQMQQKDMTLQDMYDNDLDDDEDDSEWEPLQEPCTNVQSNVAAKRERQLKDMTLQDMYDNDLDDDDDDSEWEPLQEPMEVTNVAAKRERQQKDMTLQDMYNNDLDDDDDDSEWEPLQEPMEVTKWSCVNCTMINLGDATHCNICGEHKESGILKEGFFASPFLHEGSRVQNETEVVERHKDSCPRTSASGSSTAIGFDERMLLHSEVEMKLQSHPERPDRLRAIAASLKTAGIFPGRCFPVPAREITPEELHRVHSLEHVNSVELTSHLYASYFTPDTYANEHSARAARLAAGLCSDLASEIISGHAKNGFALIRPPGHHAGVKHAMGFCLHNNAAVAAAAAQVAGAEKILIVDWDVHHGNGTQEIFDANKSVLYISLHRHEGGQFYPGTGAANEVGSMGAEGYCVNIPWSCGGVGDNDYIFAFKNIVLPIASSFAPDFTIISAGFDAARGDPLGCCDVTPVGYAQMTHMLNSVSDGKLLVILEGGYNLRSISSSATSVIKVLLGENPVCITENVMPSTSGLLTVMEVLKIQSKFWPTLESNFSKLHAEWKLFAKSLSNSHRRKKQRAVVPKWWQGGRKRWLYQVISRKLKSRTKGF